MAHEATNLVIALLPELILLAGGSVLVVFGAREKGQGRPSLTAARIALISVWAGILAMVLGPEISNVQLGPMAPIRLSTTALAARWAALLMGMVLIGANYRLPEVRPGRGEGDRASPEYFMLLLFSLAGMMLTALANDLIVLFLAVELASVPTIVAIALSRPQHEATESAGKYFFLGAVSVALLVMGMAYLFGLTGQTHLDRLTVWSMSQPGGAAGGVALIAMGLVTAGLAFNIAAFPFHVYIADVYQGAAAPLAGWLSFVTKAAGLVALAKLLMAVGGPVLGPDMGWSAQPAWRYGIWALAVATMTTGNVLALWQHNVKRLLAYSSVAHSGYLLVGLLVVPDGPGLAMSSVVIFYLVAYGLANLGAFLVLSAVRVADPAGGTREAETLADLNGLARRSPALAIAMAVFAFSLMGMPATVGFVAKIYIFVGAYKAAFTWLVVIALVNAAVGAGYYLRLVAACWISDVEGQRQPQPPPGQEQPAASLPVAEGTPPIVILILAAATVVFGLSPARIYQRLTTETRLTTRSRQPGPAAEVEPGSGGGSREGSGNGSGGGSRGPQAPATRPARAAPAHTLPAE